MDFSESKTEFHCFYKTSHLYIAGLSTWNQAVFISRVTIVWLYFKNCWHQSSGMVRSAWGVTGWGSKEGKQTTDKSDLVQFLIEETGFQVSHLPPSSYCVIWKSPKGFTLEFFGETQYQQTKEKANKLKKWKPLSKPNPIKKDALNPNSCELGIGT